MPEDGDSEPTVWQYRTVWNDAVHYTNGRFGLYKYYSDDFYIQYFSYGLDASAPLPEDVPTLAADTLTATATGTSTIDVGITENDASVTGRTLHRSTTSGFTPGAVTRSRTSARTPRQPTRTPASTPERPTTM